MSAPTFEPRRRELLLAAMAVLSGCGGVDSGGTGTGASSTYANGPITGFGSIIVNGVRFDESIASIEDDDGQALSRDSLRLGMRTEIAASAITTLAGVSGATASSIRLQREIVGPLESIDTINARLVVLGQTVSVVATTAFDGAITSGMASLVAGDMLEIYASLDVAAGRYVASRIARRTTAMNFKLRGVVTSLSLEAKTLVIGTLAIDWSNVAPADPAMALAPGRLVRFTLSTTPQSGVWHATALSSGQPMPADRDAAEVEGRITAFTSATAFSVDGLPVDASGASFPNGSAGLSPGTRVEVRGRLSSGVLLASRVAVEGDESTAGNEAFELHGSIESLDATAFRFVVRAVTVSWSTTTRFEGGGAANLRVGQAVEVKGRLSADGLSIEATLVHFES